MSVPNGHQPGKRASQECSDAEGVNSISRSSRDFAQKRYAMPDTPHTDSQIARRRRLQELKQEAAAASANESVETTKPIPEGPVKSMEDVQQRELLEFLRGLVERDRERRVQLDLIRGFLQNPVEFGLETEAIPTSSTPEEIAQRRKEIKYRIALLSSMLEIYKGEIAMLDMAEYQHSAGQTEY